MREVELHALYQGSCVRSSDIVSLSNNLLARTEKAKLVHARSDTRLVQDTPEFELSFLKKPR
jgi:hypothetical protein